MFRALDDCLACGGSALFEYLDLGMQPLANAFHDGSQTLARYALAVCCCRNCWHSQLTVSVNPEEMFTGYRYVSGTSETLRQYFKVFASRFRRDIRVLDIGSNDGSLLDAFTERGCQTVGVEPAEEVAELSRGMPHRQVLQGYWNATAAACCTVAGRFDIITAFNVLAHTPDPLTFLKIAAGVLKPGGSIWVQTSQANMVLDGTFDTIYHEHVSYFTPRSIDALARRAGLYVNLIEFVPVHGGSMLVELVADSGPRHTFTGPLYEEKSYDTFAEKTRVLIAQVRGMGVAPPKIGYGAAAKGMTFLNATGLMLDRIVDDNPRKWGLLTPGSNVPVGRVENLPRGEGIIFVLAWNFWDEILRRIRSEHGSGHSIMRFFPKIEYVMS